MIPFTCHYYDEEGTVKSVKFRASEKRTAEDYARKSIYNLKSIIKLEEGKETNE